jgi:hypothetical protein
MIKFLLYACKSTDVEDKQVLSIGSQINELRDFAKRENLEIIDEFTELEPGTFPKGLPAGRNNPLSAGSLLRRGA